MGYANITSAVFVNLISLDNSASGLPVDFCARAIWERNAVRYLQQPMNVETRLLQRPMSGHNYVIIYMTHSNGTLLNITHVYFDY